MALFAAGIDGKWIAETQGRNGAQQSTLTLKSAGSALTGTLEAPGRGGAAPTPVEIKDGKIDGAKFSFSVTGGRGVAIWEGTVEGDELKGNRKQEGQDARPFTAKRAK